MIFNSIADRKNFIEDNMKLVSSRVIKLNNGIFDDDLYQVGSLALIDATDRFDENKGILFSTYAVRYIDGYILTYKNHDTAIKPIRKKTINGYFQYKDVDSLDKPIGDGEISFGDTIYMQDSFEDDILISVFLDSLKEKERDIINYIISGFTQKEISKKICISQPQVHRIIRKVGERYKRYQFV